MAGNIAKIRRAIFGHVFPINGSTTPLSSLKQPPTTGSGNVTASPRHPHWEAVKRLLRYSPNTPDPRFALMEIRSPQKGYPNTTAAWPWTGVPHQGVHPPSSRATTSHQRTVARRHRSLAAPSQPPSGNSTTLFFKHCSSHRDHMRAA